LGFKIGFHVSIAGGIQNSVSNAVQIGCTAFQIFTRSPRSWTEEALEKQQIQLFRSNLRKSQIQIDSVVVHMTHLPNLSSPGGELYEKSVSSFTNELIRTSKLGIKYLVIDLGSDMGHGKENGVKQLVKSCEIAVDNFKSAYKKSFDVTVLLQNGWGSGNSIGTKLEDLREILDKLPDKGYGICIDTCHAFVAGYDLRTRDTCNKFIEELDKQIGFDNIRLIHLNDSKMDIGSRTDEHEHLELGKIGVEGLKTIINHKSFRNIPMVMQPLFTSIEDHSEKLKFVQKLRNLINCN
jgi:deoxyribonuclease-4